MVYVFRDQFRPIRDPFQNGNGKLEILALGISDPKRP